MAMSKTCSICSNNLQEDEEFPPSLNLQFPSESSSSCLSPELQVIFVLRNLLHVPSTIITDLLGGSQNGQNTNPSNWGLLFCSSCGGIVSQAQDLFTLINKLIKDYEEVGRRLRKRATSTLLAKNPTKVAKISKSRKRSVAQNDKLEEDKISIIRRYLMGSVPYPGTGNVAKKQGKGGRPAKNGQQKRGKKISTLNHEEAEGHEMKIVINNVQTISYQDNNDFPLIKCEPEEENDASWVEMMEDENVDGNYYSDVNFNDDDDDLPNLPMEIDPLEEKYQEEDSQNLTPPRRRTARANKKLAKVDQGDESNEDDDDNQERDDEGWKQGSSSEEEEDEDPEFEIISKKKRKLEPSKGKPKRERRRTTTTTPRLGSKKGKVKKGWLRCPNCAANCENLVIYEAHILRMHKGVKFPYTCELCPRKWSHLAGILRHIDQRHQSEIKNDTVEVEDEPADAPPPTESEIRNKTNQLFDILYQIDDVAKNEDCSNDDVTPNLKEFGSENKIFTCTKCSNVKFNSRITAEIHRQRVHTGVNSKHLCPECDLVFLTKLGRQDHENEAHPTVKNEGSNEGGEQDNLDTEIIPKKKRKLAHDGTSDKKIPKKPPKTGQRRLVSSRKRKKWWIKCPNCSANCENLVIYEAHILRMHKGVTRPYICELCPRKVSHLAGLLRHIDQRHQSEIKNDSVEDEQEAVYGPPADEPSQLFDSLFQIDDAEEQEDCASTDATELVSENKIFTCTKCSNVKFNSRITAEIHRHRVHTGIHSKHLCSDCGLMFLTELGLKDHQDEAHPSANRPFNPKTFCQECKINFESSLYLGQHMRRTHRAHLHAAKEKQCMCELCPATFIDPADLVFHQRKHHHEELGLTPFQCHICSKILYSKRNLQAHVLTHTKEFKFLCPHCPQGFPAKPQKDHHIRVVHFNEKRHKCTFPHCTKSFSQGINLKYHIRTHTGEKPLKCTEPGCDRAFSDPPTYKRHLESHGNKIHTCPDCGRQFKVWHSFRTHCKTHQKDGGGGSSSRNKTRTRKPRRKQEEEVEDSEEQGYSNESHEMPNLRPQYQPASGDFGDFMTPSLGMPTMPYMVHK